MTSAVISAVISLVTSPVIGLVTAYAAEPSWPLVATLLVLAAVLTVVGLVLLVRTRGGR